MRPSKPSFLFAVFTWSVLLLRFGYRYGTGDQVELLPYTLFLHDPTLYLHDFFIKGLHAAVPNERTIMANLLLPFVKHLECFVFLLHFVVTVVLVMGLEKLALRFIPNKYFAWFAILLCMVPLNDYALGNVDLVSDCLQAGNVAIAFVVWAINLFLDKRFTRASVLMSIATFIQLLEGLDVMMLLSGMLLLATLLGEVNWKEFAKFLAIYAFTAGIYLVVILGKKLDTAGNGGLDNETFFQILFVFRHPHHFIFSAFPLAKKVIFFFLAFTGLVFFAMRNQQVFRFLQLGLLGIAVYAVAVDKFHLIFIGNFQFYKVAQWAKFFGVIAVVELARVYLFVGTEKWLPLKGEKWLIGGAIVMFWVLMHFRTLLPYNVPFEVFGMKQLDPLITICGQIQQQTPKDAVFVVPFDNTAFKFYAQRSCYVEFKANVRHRSFVKEWYNRVQQVYGVGLESKTNGFQLQQLADEYYYHPDFNRIMALKAAGVTHMLVATTFNCPYGSLILRNSSYAVYQL